MSRYPQLTYHGPARDSHGCIVGWPNKHAVIVALDPARRDRAPELRAAEALAAAVTYCYPEGIDEPNGSPQRRPVAVLPAPRVTYPSRADEWRVILAAEPSA